MDRWQGSGTELFDRSYDYDKLGRLTERRENGHRWRFAYDGEVPEKQGLNTAAEYEWNGRGELVEAELPDGSTVSYGYDAFGRLVRRVKTPADGEVPPVAELSVYISHGRQVLAEYDRGEGGELELYKEYFRRARKSLDSIEPLA